MRPAILPVLCLAPALALAATQQAHTFSASVGPGGQHEECMKLQKDETRRFEWSANAAVDFNIHYHEGSEVFYPLKRDGVTKDKGTFKAKIAQDYCWMWTARDKPVKLEGRIESK